MAARSDSVSVESGLLGADEFSFLFIDPRAGEIWNGLIGWKWLDLGGLCAVSVSALGDIFFRAPDGAIEQLNTRDGSLVRVARDLGELQSTFQDAEGRERLLLESLINGARNSGLLLEKGECYDFVVAPALGGEVSPRTVTKLPFLLKMQMAGRLHQELRHAGALVKQAARAD